MFTSEVVSFSIVLCLALVSRFNLSYKNELGITVIFMTSGIFCVRLELSET